MLRAVIGGCQGSIRFNLKIGQSQGKIVIFLFVCFVHHDSQFWKSLRDQLGSRI